MFSLNFIDILLLTHIQHILGLILYASMPDNFTVQSLNLFLFWICHYLPLQSFCNAAISCLSKASLVRQCTSFLFAVLSVMWENCFAGIFFIEPKFDKLRFLTLFRHEIFCLGVVKYFVYKCSVLNNDTWFQFPQIFWENNVYWYQK